MRLRVAHSSVYRYDPPAAGVIQMLRLTPRNHEGLYVVSWRIDITPDARLVARDDAFGNITHVFTAEGPLSELHVEVEGHVETQNTDGIVRGTIERFPPSLFLRGTALTQADTAIQGFAAKIRAMSGGVVLAELHGILDRLHEEMAQADAASDTNSSRSTTTAAQAFAQKRGSAEDLTHIFIGAGQSLGIPCRYVSGYFRRPDTSDPQGTSHAWAEAHVDGLGWIAFDPANGYCPTDAHVRVAIGLDSPGAAPMRGTRLGSGGESVAVAIKVDQ
jgi:transglutaminase-like putative cysteine protease